MTGTRATKAELSMLTVAMLRELKGLENVTSRSTKAELVDAAYSAKLDLGDLKKDHLMHVLAQSNMHTSGVRSKQDIVMRLRCVAQG